MLTFITKSKSWVLRFNLVDNEYGVLKYEIYVTNLMENFLFSKSFQTNHLLPSNNRVQEWVELYLRSTTCLHGVHRGNVAIGLFCRWT
jgi:hypothetical protein